MTNNKRKYQLQNYRPHPGQNKLHKSTAKEIMIVSATRAGKTESLMHDIITRAWNNKEKFGTIKYQVLVGAPTTALVRDVLEEPIARKLRDEYDLLSFHYKNAHTIKLKNNIMIYFATLEKDAVDNAIRGREFSDIYVDEAALVNEYAMEVLRLRLLSVPNNQGRLVMATTPKGKNNWVWEKYFSNPDTSDGRRPDVEYLEYLLSDNPAISPDAIEDMKANVDPLMYRQEVLAEFVNLYEDAVYYQFDDINIAKCEYDPMNYVYVGLDFNVNKNAWVAVQKQRNNTLQVVAEGYGARTTPDAAKEIINKYGQRATIVPDQTGKALQGSGHTNIELLIQSGLTSVVEESSNPNREKRYALVNAFMLNALNQRRLTIDPSCKRTIRELRELSYKKNTNQIDTKGDKIGHISDALGYVLYYLQDYVGQIIDDDMPWWRRPEHEPELREIYQGVVNY